ncbi:MAG: asparaginase [Rhodospirillaceae bacterium]|nr:asparaginase [Rhodospirillaceae bacterium]
MPQSHSPSLSTTDPVLVEVTRGPLVESRHRGAAAVVDSAGHTVAAWGDVARPVFPRSAIKALQAIALVESGAADAFDLGPAELALACASHNGEAAHAEAVRAWLLRIDLGVDDLECGAHAPMGEEAELDLVRAGREAGAHHNNCSGKHAGMLTLAKRLGVPTAGYIAADHPVQSLVRRTVGEMAGCDLAEAPAGTDGCGIPTLAMPLEAMAWAFARIADPATLAPERAAAVRRIRAAVAARPDMVAGRGRFCTAVMAAAGEAVFVKTGAEGVFCAALPDMGLGFALKIEDGATRAAECAIAALLLGFGAADGPGAAALTGYTDRTLRNWAGTETGTIRPAAHWPD